jgi:L-cysteine S-thiosulfotransferase
MGQARLHPGPLAERARRSATLARFVQMVAPAAFLAAARVLVPGLAAACLSAPVKAQAAADETGRQIERYREAVADSSPGELWEIRGEDLWKQKRGPRKVSLEGCDLGLGPGVVAGAYVELPRYFADAGRVMDLESRLAWCMETVQGFSPEAVRAQPFSSQKGRSDFESLSAYIAAQSRGLRMMAPMNRAEERAAYALGRAIFFTRAGTHDFSCASCHGQSGRRIRLQDLPDLREPQEVGPVYASWPAYRFSDGEMRTLEWRLRDCFRQQRLPELRFGSEVAIALTSYLAHNADGAVMAAPGTKR